jgi:hypothetical protein
MTASLIPNARQQFVDVNGNPLVGGAVYFYQVNTLIPKDTWQDSAQTILNDNPVILDSRGQATIYGSGSYRQVLNDADGNTIWDGNIEDFEATVFGAQGTIASATTTNLGSVGSNNILVTGTTTINSFGASASLGNPLYFIQFAGILTLTYNATSMILPGAANITTAAGDSALVEFTNASGYWRMVAYFPASVSGVTGTAANYNIGTSGATVPLLNGANVWSGINRFQKQTYGDEVALTVTANASTPDFALGNYFTATISSSYTLHNPVNAQPGQSGLFRIAQSSSSLGITWGSAYKSAGGIATVNLSGVSGIDYFAFYAHSSSEIVISPMLNVS